jgi:CRISPR-associated protein Cst2
MRNNNTIYELAILGRVTWNLHSLNNEGSIGNVVEPRTLKLADGTTTDGISGEMLKHIHAARVWELETDKSKFCPACRILGPMRAEQNRKVTQFGRGKEIEATTQALQDCVLCDVHGFLVQRPTIHRQSTVEFGWAVGLRGEVYRDIHQHARHIVGERPGPEGQPPAQQEAEAPLAQEVGEPLLEAAGQPPAQQETEAPQEERPEVPVQMLYSRPTRSGVYALVSVFQPWRIGLNTVNYKYVEGLDRQSRYQLALQAYRTMFLRTDGAMTSTRLPHLEAFEGIIVVSRANFPVPVVSPLKEGYREEIEALAKANGESFECIRFNDLVGFVNALRGFEDDKPYELEMPEQNEG